MASELDNSKVSTSYGLLDFVESNTNYYTSSGDILRGALRLGAVGCIRHGPSAMAAPIYRYVRCTTFLGDMSGSLPCEDREGERRINNLDTYDIATE